MRGFNKAIIAGRLGKDPELKEFENSKVCKLVVATSEKYKDKETTEWHTVTIWGVMAENCAKYLHKGSAVLVEGSIHTRSYEKDNIKRYTTEIKATSVQFLDSAPKTEEVTDPSIPF